MSQTDERKIVATNRKARYEYEILETYEAGLVLAGTEVKSLRGGRANLQEAYAHPLRGELFVYNLHISPYEAGNRENRDPIRPRKLLLHKKEIRRLAGKIAEKGLTLVPLLLYFKEGYAKLELGLGRGKKLYDRRRAIREREMKREIERAHRERFKA